MIVHRCKSSRLLKLIDLLFYFILRSLLVLHLREHLVGLHSGGAVRLGGDSLSYISDVYRSLTSITSIDVRAVGSLK